MSGTPGWSVDVRLQNVLEYIYIILIHFECYCSSIYAYSGPKIYPNTSTPSGDNSPTGFNALFLFNVLSNGLILSLFFSGADAPIVSVFVQI